MMSSVRLRTGGMVRGDHTEAVVEIFPKFSILHQGVEILVGGGNQPEIYFLGVTAPMRCTLFPR